MNTTIPRAAIPRAASALTLALLLSAAPAMAQTSDSAAHSHDHKHDHKHDHAAPEKTVSAGYFKDAQVQDRPLADWAGDWQSLYPYLIDGTLDPVMAHKAESGDKTAAEYRAYYDIGYKTDVDHIRIDGDLVTFTRGDKAVSGHYASDGYQILTYQAGNRGVRFIFKKTQGDADAPGYIQFSDHAIAPVKAGHYHLYWGNDRAALLDEVTNWPTYYPATLNGAQILDEMLAH